MNKKLIVSAVVVIIALILVLAIGLMFPSSPAKVTVTYDLIHGFRYVTPGDVTMPDSTFVGDATWIVVYLNLTTTKDTTIETNDFHVTYNGQEVTNLRTDVGWEDHLYPQKEQTIQISLMYTVAGKLDGPFELTYTGNADVTIK